MTQTEHAKNLYDLALSVVRERGRQIGTGSMMVTVYQHGLLTIRYRPKLGTLDVLHLRKVLRIERWLGTSQVIHYTPGSWEGDLVEAAKVAA
jgi:hypothetical protein